jgi:putative secretion ATPase (PEP-CTERM system associated)
MYDTFYKLRARPFQLSPDPRFFFKSASHKRALAYLLYGVRQGEGFVVITGDVGTGKTTLAQALFRSIQQERVVAAQIVSTQIQEDDLLRLVASSFGLPFEGVSKAGLLKSLEGFFRACHQEKKRVLLVVDESQNLPPRAIEELRMLSNFQLGGRMLVQSFLLGQKEFRTIMRSPSFEQLRQRVIAAYHLQPLDAEETKAYVEHRLKLVGWQDDPVIDEDVYEVIHQFSDGVPRRVNTLCDRLFLHASLEETHHITREVVEVVTRDIIEEQGGFSGAEIATGTPAYDPWANRFNAGPPPGPAGSGYGPAPGATGYAAEGGYGGTGATGSRNLPPDPAALAGHGGGGRVVGFPQHGGAPAPGAPADAGQDRVNEVAGQVEALKEAFKQELSQLRRAILAAQVGGKGGGS